jgi:hypothetical protein
LIASVIEKPAVHSLQGSPLLLEREQVIRMEHDRPYVQPLIQPPQVEHVAGGEQKVIELFDSRALSVLGPVSGELLQRILIGQVGHLTAHVLEQALHELGGRGIKEARVVVDGSAALVLLKQDVCARVAMHELNVLEHAPTHKDQVQVVEEKGDAGAQQLAPKEDSRLDQAVELLLMGAVVARLAQIDREPAQPLCRHNGYIVGEATLGQVDGHAAVVAEDDEFRVAVDQEARHPVHGELSVGVVRQGHNDRTVDLISFEYHSNDVSLVVELINQSSAYVQQWLILGETFDEWWWRVAVKTASAEHDNVADEQTERNDDDRPRRTLTHLHDHIYL